jgi:hypothetical protein
MAGLTPVTMKCMAAAQAAQAHDFIMSFPEGYDTRIEQRGANLFGRAETAHCHCPCHFIAAGGADL